MLILKLSRYIIAAILAIVDDIMRIAAVLFLKTSIKPGLNFHQEQGENMVNFELS